MNTIISKREYNQNIFSKKCGPFSAVSFEWDFFRLRQRLVWTFFWWAFYRLPLGNALHLCLIFPGILVSYSRLVPSQLRFEIWITTSNDEFWYLICAKMRNCMDSVLTIISSSWCYSLARCGMSHDCKGHIVSLSPLKCRGKRIGCVRYRRVYKWRVTLYSEGNSRRAWSQNIGIWREVVETCLIRCIICHTEEIVFAELLQISLNFPRAEVCVTCLVFDESIYPCSLRT